MIPNPMFLSFIFLSLLSFKSTKYCRDSNKAFNSFAHNRFAFLKS